MLTVLPAIRTARPFGQSVAVGLRLRILRLSSPPCHTLVPQDIFIYPPVFCLPPLFPWRLSSQSSAARFLSSTLRFFSLAGSGYALRLPLLAWHNAGPRNLRCRSSLTGCRSPPPRSGGSTFSLLPQRPCRPLCLTALSVSPVSPAKHRSRFSPAPRRCRRWADAVTRTYSRLSPPYVSGRPATLRSSPPSRDEGVSVT